MTWTSKGEHRFAVPVALFYGALFVVYGIYVPFMPVWLNWRGLTSGEIGVVIAAPLFLRAFVTPAVALTADRNGAHRAYLILVAWAALAFVVMLAVSRSFWPILFFAVLLTICTLTIMPLIETIAVQGGRVRGLDYGRMRLWGSLSFVAASFAGGVAITRFGGGSTIWLLAIGCALTLIVAHLLPATDSNRGAPVPGRALGAARPFWRADELRDLFAQQEFRLFLVAAGLVQAAHATFFTFGTLLWQKQGLSATWCGALWAIGVFAEVLLFSFSGYAAERFGAARLMTLGAIASIVRWLVLALQPGLAVLVPLQLLHGLTYGATHIGAMHFIHDAVPRDKSGSAQALYATVSAGVAMGVTTLIAGIIYPRSGALAYVAMAGFALVSLVAGTRLSKTWNGRALVFEPVI